MSCMQDHVHSKQKIKNIIDTHTRIRIIVFPNAKLYPTISYIFLNVLNDFYYSLRIYIHVYLYSLKGNGLQIIVWFIIIR